MKTWRVAFLIGLTILALAMTACSGVAQNLNGKPGEVPITDMTGRDGVAEPGVALDPGAAPD